MDTHESAARAAATSGGAVVFAGCTVMIALLSLAVVGIPLVTTLGYTSALVVAVAVVAAVTLLPALLGVVGDRIDSLRLPLPRRPGDARTGGWYRWGEFVARHPVPAAVIPVVVLLVLALPARDLYLGQQDNGALLLAGRANWWFPRFLDRRVPNVSIEGEEWFRELDQPASAIVRSPGRS